MSPDGDALAEQPPGSLERLGGFLMVFDYAKYCQLMDELEAALDEIPDNWRSFKPCQHCNEEMLTWRRDQKYCSKQCQGAAERAARNYPVQEWGKLYQAGATYRQIAEKYGVSYAVVRRNTQKAGFPPRTDHEHLRKYDAKPRAEKPV